MSANDHLNPRQFDTGQVRGQLPMFMTGREIMQTHRPGDALGIKSQEQHIWEGKAYEANDSGMHLDIAHDGGVHTPVALGPPGVYPERSGGGRVDDTRPTLVNGHHRVVSEAQHAPHRLLPVSHVDGYTREAFPSQDAYWDEEETGSR